MFLKTLFVTLSLLSFTLQSGFTADSSYHRQKVQNYLSAVNSKNEQLIQSAWLSIVKDEETLAYLKEYMPKKFLMVQAQGLLYQVEGIFDNYNEQLDLGGLKPKGKLASGNLIVEEPAKTTRTNGEIAEARADIPLVDNQVYALRNPNQNRVSNQDVISRRLSRLYKQIQERFE